MSLKFIIIGLRVNDDRVVGVELKMSPQRELKNVVDIYKKKQRESFLEGHRES
jgi:hypothetical protein